MKKDNNNGDKTLLATNIIFDSDASSPTALQALIRRVDLAKGDPGEPGAAGATLEEIEATITNITTPISTQLAGESERIDRTKTRVTNNENDISTIRGKVNPIVENILPNIESRLDFLEQGNIPEVDTDEIFRRMNTLETEQQVVNGQIVEIRAQDLAQDLRLDNIDNQLISINSKLNSVLTEELVVFETTGVRWQLSKIGNNVTWTIGSVVGGVNPTGIPKIPAGFCPLEEVRFLFSNRGGGISPDPTLVVSELQIDSEGNITRRTLTSSTLWNFQIGQGRGYSFSWTI